MSATTQERKMNSAPKISAVMDWRDIPVDRTPADLINEWKKLGKPRRPERRRKP